MTFIKSITHIENEYIGYEIVTNEYTIGLKIENFQYCCEDFGTNIIYPDNKSKEDILGAEITNVCWGRDFVNNAVKRVQIEITTNKGLIIIQCYKYGYYLHSLCAYWDGYKDEQEL